jgi:hypothetical protein
MKHRVAILSTATVALVAGLWWSVWLLVTGPLAHLVHSPVQTTLAVTTMTLVCVSLLTGILVGEWDPMKEMPRKHHHIALRTRFHH